MACWRSRIWPSAAADLAFLAAFKAAPSDLMAASASRSTASRASSRAGGSGTHRGPPVAISGEKSDIGARALPAGPTGPSAGLDLHGDIAVDRETQQ